MQQDYAPVLGFDPDSGATLWEPWIAGFERAMRLRSDAWGRIALGDDEVRHQGCWIHTRRNFWNRFGPGMMLAADAPTTDGRKNPVTDISRIVHSQDRKT